MALIARAFCHKQFIRSCRSGSRRHILVRTYHNKQPCIVFTNTNSRGSEYLQELAKQVRSQLQCEALVIQPAEQQHSTQAATAAATAAATYSYDQELQLLPQPEYGSYLIPGATAADCVLCAVDQKAGLLQSLGLSPVLVVVGIHRGPALASDAGMNPAVAVATQAAQLGLPAIASCLATPSPSAPLQPAVEATLQLLQQVVACLKAGRDSWPAAANMPRAHLPFPEAGRWALGKELPLPQQTSSSSSSQWQPDDCWALGEDNSWAGRHNSRQASSSQSMSVSSSRPVTEAHAILRRAFVDGDILLCLNVPPTWKHSSITAAFASTRPGVLWHCCQVEAVVNSPAAEGSSGSSSSSSWWREEQDVYGRSLPSSSYATGSSIVSGGFVAQDNTDKLISASCRWPHLQEQQQSSIPASFVIRRGTLLNDHATAGDVEAVFGGRAAVSTLQTWPAGHPLALRDDVLAAALNEDYTTGLPAWLSNMA